MPSSPFKTKTFHLTALDREMLDPDRGRLVLICGTASIKSGTPSTSALSRTAPGPPTSVYIH